MHIAGPSDGNVYTYNMPDPIDTRLASLTQSDPNFGDFSPSQKGKGIRGRSSVE